MNDLRRVDVHLAQRYHWPLADVEALLLWVRDWLALMEEETA